MKPNQLYSGAAIFCYFIFFTACNNSNTKNDATPPSTQQTIFEKILGTWQSEDAKSFERWAKKDDGTFQSVAFNVKGSDTSWNENARIFPENEKWVFENTVKGQNDGKAIRFVSSLLSENSVQFSNPEHDFPTDINYTIVDANTLHAFIVGPNSMGSKDTIRFNYTRYQ